MLYYGYFRDNKSSLGGISASGGALYCVCFTTNNSTVTQQQITIGHPGFVTEMDGDNDIIYNPVKYQKATVVVVTDDYISDFFATTPKAVKVELRRVTNSNTYVPGGTTGSSLMWSGFVSPNMYNQPFEASYQEMEVECIDKLSMLKYYKYEPYGNSYIPNVNSAKGVITFTNIIQRISYLTGLTFKISSSTNLTTTLTSNPLVSQLYISEENFFEKKDDDNQTDKDVAWTYAEVLEELMRFLNLSAVQYQGNIYCIDYDARKSNSDGWWTIGTNGNATYSAGTASNYALTYQKMMNGGQTLSVIEPYNKVTVVDELYTFDSIIPSFYEGLSNITSSTDTTLTSSTDFRRGIGKIMQSSLGNEKGDTNNNLIYLIDRIKNDQHNKYTSYNLVFTKYFDSSNYILHKYNFAGQSQFNYTDTKTLRGAIIAKMYTVKMEKEVDSRDPDDWIEQNGTKSFDLTNYMLILNPEGNGHITNGQITSYPMIESNGNSAFNTTFGGDNCYLIIKGSYYYHHYNDHPYPYPSGDDYDPSYGRFRMEPEDTFLYCKLEWGGQYWNGETWTTTSSTFKLPYMNTSNIHDLRIDETMCKHIKFPNFVTHKIGTTEEGYVIPIPSGNMMSGGVHITIYKSLDPPYYISTSSHRKVYNRWPHTLVILKDFDIVAVVGDPTMSGTNDSDTIYTNIINDEFVNELKEIKFKINTWDNKKPNHSCVLINNGNAHLDKTYSVGLYAGETSDWYDFAGVKNGYMRQEEHLIYRLVNQYNSPTVTYDATIDMNGFSPISIFSLPSGYQQELQGMYFIADSWSIDYENRAAGVHLVQKK